MRIENVADHPAFVELIARWHWDEWGHADPGGSLQSWTAGLARRTNPGWRESRSALPGDCFGSQAA